MGKWMPIDDFVFTASAERLPMYPTEIRVTNQGRTVILAEYETEYEIDFQDKRLCRLTDDAAEVDMQLIAAAAERLTLSDLEMERDLGYRLLTMVAKLQEANNE